MFAKRRASLAHARILAGAAAGLLALASAGCRAAPDDQQARALPTLGLMTTLPIYWPEAHDVGELLQSGQPPGLARRVLEARFVLAPLDTLEVEALRGHGRLLLAQPRALLPAENVALDQWVRGGGRLLIFADPMLTQHSHFGIGDKRRAQDVVLLSPILRHWGLELSFDPDQPAAIRVVDVDGTGVPVALAGAFTATTPGACVISAQGMLARCRIGRGTATIFADAAVLEDASDDDSERREAAIERLTTLAFD